MVSSEYKERVVEALTLYPEGISFNKLYEVLKEYMSKNTLSKCLEELEREGLVEKTPKRPRRGQKVIWRLTDEGGEAWRRFREWAVKLGLWPEEVEWRKVVSGFGEALRRGDVERAKEVLVKFITHSSLLIAISLRASLDCPGAAELLTSTTLKLIYEYLADLFEGAKEGDLEALKRAIDEAMEAL